jgi:PAS domain-containing protein
MVLTDAETGLCVRVNDAMCALRDVRVTRCARYAMCALRDVRVARCARYAMCALLDVRVADRPRELLIGVNLDLIVHPDDRRALGDARDAIHAGSDPAVRQHELRFLRPDGTAGWASLNAAPVFSAAGALKGLFSQVIDITGRKGLEAQFEHDVNDAVWLGRIRDAIDDDRLVLSFACAPRTARSSRRTSSCRSPSVMG